ncbi:hypothetical protein [Euzebya sp.]|uniref:hypothetical protein n=1 Tax=Euzebya sp. TaxID=1971409 RepID=UPI0035199D68
MAQSVTCPNCRSDDLLVVRLSPKDTPMRFHTCRHCEHRWWEDIVEGTDVALTAVLAHIAG